MDTDDLLARAEALRESEDWEAALAAYDATLVAEPDSTGGLFFRPGLV